MNPNKLKYINNLYYRGINKRLENVCKSVIKFVHNLEESPGIYKMSESSKASLISSCFASFIIYGLSKFSDGIDNKLKKIENYILKYKLQDGTFWDTTYTCNKSSVHDDEYLKLQFTTLALSALSICSSIVNMKVNFKEELYDTMRLKKWLHSLNWKNSWLEGNRVLYLGIIFLHNWKNCNEKEAGEAFTTLLDYLDILQDPSTGYWGTNKGATLHNAMAGSFHILLLYDYMNRKFNYIEKIIDNTLLIQNRFDNLFSIYPGGGACDDVDGIYTLVSCSQKSNYKKNEIIEALERSYIAINLLQNTDGGFPYSKRSTWGLDLVRYIFGTFFKDMSLEARKTRLYMVPQVITKCCLPFQFSGNNKIVVKPHESDLFSTWFRMYSLALIDFYINKSNWEKGFNWWNFLYFPGLGWQKI